MAPGEAPARRTIRVLRASVPSIPGATSPANAAASWVGSAVRKRTGTGAAPVIVREAATNVRAAQTTAAAAHHGSTPRRVPARFTAESCSTSR